MGYAANTQIHTLTDYGASGGDLAAFRFGAGFGPITPTLTPKNIATADANNTIYLFFWVKQKASTVSADVEYVINNVAKKPLDANITAAGSEADTKLGWLTNYNKDAAHPFAYTGDALGSGWSADNYIKNQARVDLNQFFVTADIQKYQSILSVNTPSSTVFSNGKEYNTGAVTLAAPGSAKTFNPGEWAWWRVSLRNTSRAAATLNTGFQVIDTLPHSIGLAISQSVGGLDKPTPPVMTAYYPNAAISAAPYVELKPEDYDYTPATPGSSGDLGYGGSIIFHPTQDTLNALSVKLGQAGAASPWANGLATQSTNTSLYSGVTFIYNTVIHGAASGYYTNNSYLIADPAPSGPTRQVLQDYGVINGNFIEEGAASQAAYGLSQEGVHSDAMLFVVGVYGIEAWKEVKNSFGDTATGRYDKEEYVDAIGGDRFTYTLNIRTDSANYGFDDLVIIDQIPYIGDTGTIDQTPRQTGWNPLMPDDPKVTVMLGAVNITTLPGVKIEYSAARSSELTSGEDWQGLDTNPNVSWYDTVGEMRSLGVSPSMIRVTLPKHAGKTASANPLIKGKDLTISYQMIASNGETPGLIAWNSFGYALLPYGIAGTSAPKYGFDDYYKRLSAEPIRVGVRIQPFKIVAAKQFSSFIGQNTIGANPPYADVTITIKEVTAPVTTAGVTNVSLIPGGHAYIIKGAGASGGEPYVLNASGTAAATIAAGRYIITEDAINGYELKNVTLSSGGVTSPVKVDTVGGAPVTQDTYAVELVSQAYGGRPNGGKLNNDSLTITAVNDLLNTDYSFTKTTNAGEPLDGARFTLYSAEDCLEIHKIPGKTSVSDSVGLVSFSGLNPANIYYMKETLSPENYADNNTVYRFEPGLGGAGGLYYKTAAGIWAPVTGKAIINTKYSLTFSFMKTGDLQADNAGLNGAVFDVYEDTAVPHISWNRYSGGAFGTKVGSFISGANGSVGEVLISGLWYGSFLVIEDNAPAPYITDKAIYKLTITKGSPDVYEFSDAKNPGAQVTKIQNLSETFDISFTKYGEFINPSTNVISTVRLPNVSFGLFIAAADATPAYTATSDSSGLVTFIGVRPGIYFLRETASSTVYAACEWVVTMNNSGSITIAKSAAGDIAGDSANGWAVINTLPKFDFSFEKTMEEETRHDTSGVTFGIFYDESGLRPAHNSANAPITASRVGGIVTFVDLTAGTYYIKEQTTAADYRLDGAAYKLIIAASGASALYYDNGYDNGAEWISVWEEAAKRNGGYTIENKLKSGDFEFQKFEMTSAGAQTNTPVTGARFALYRADTDPLDSNKIVGYDPQSALETIITDASGTAEIHHFDGVTSGYYALREINTPNNYTTANKGNPYYVVAEYNGVSGVMEYSIYSALDSSGYVDLATRATYNGVPGDIIYNTRLMGGFTVYKTDERGDALSAGLSSSTFELSKTPDFGDVISASNGGNAFVFSDLKLGEDYYLRENAPAAYTANSAVYRVTLQEVAGVTTINVSVYSGVSPDITVNAAALSVTVTNTLKRFDFPVRKIGERAGANGLVGVTLSLSQNGNLISSKTTSPTGLAWFRNIGAGSYTLTEGISTAAYHGNGSWNVEIRDDGMVTITPTGTTPGSIEYFNPGGGAGSNAPLLQNALKRFAFSFAKTAEDGVTKLADAEFALFATRDGLTPARDDLDGGRQYTAVTNDSGVATFSHISADTYYMKETVAPPGYALNTDVYMVVVDDAGGVSFAMIDDSGAITPITGGLTVVDVMERFSFSFTKKDLTDNAALPGAEFTLERGGAALATAISGANGIVAFSGLTTGDYKIYETRAPLGYAADTSIYTLTVGAGGATSLTAPNGAIVARVDNKRIALGRLDFVKTDHAGAPVDGAVFALFDDSAALIPTVRVAKNTAISAGGRVAFADVPWGTYYMREISAPAPYQAAQTIWTIIIAPDLSWEMYSGATIISSKTIVNTIAGESESPYTPPYQSAPVVITPSGETISPAPSGSATPVPSGESASPRPAESNAPSEPVYPGESAYIPGASIPPIPPIPPAPPIAPPVPNTPAGIIVPNGDGTYIELDDSGTPLGTWKWDDDQNDWVFEPIAQGTAHPNPKTGEADSSREIARIIFPLTFALWVTTAIRRRVRK